MLLSRRHLGVRQYFEWLRKSGYRSLYGQNFNAKPEQIRQNHQFEIAFSSMPSLGAIGVETKQKGNMGG